MNSSIPALRRLTRTRAVSGQPFALRVLTRRGTAGMPFGRIESTLRKACDSRPRDFEDVAVVAGAAQVQFIRLTHDLQS